SFNQILENHVDISAELLKKFKPLQYFDEYLQQGSYPFIIESKDDYHEKLLNVLSTVLETDLPAIHHIDFASILKMKKLLMVLPDFVPYTPNIQKLASITGISRDSLLKYLYYLNKAKIVKHLTKNAHGINFLNKPEKLFLHNTNLMYALSSEKPNRGKLRETFFFNQVTAMQTVTYPAKADFLVNEKYLFEVGGKNKTQKQIAKSKHAYIVKDDIEYGYGNIIPLWLFGLMY
ncbi:MAG: AAA family ATPase, partial [Bacteroidetes bacterium]